MTQLCVFRWWSSWGWERERSEDMKKLIMRNCDFRQYCGWVNSPSPLCQVRVPIQCVFTPILGLPHPIRQVVPWISHIRFYPPHCCHFHTLSLSFSATTPPSSHNTKFSHPSLSCHDHELTQSTAYTKCSIHTVQYTPSTAFTEFSIHPGLFVLCSFSWSRVNPWM